MSQEAKTPNDLELFHFGVKGMKWGVRRPVDSATGLVKSGASKAKTAAKESISRPKSDEAKTAEASRKRIKAHGTDSMSNKQLQELVTRMNLEQQYNSLMDSEKASKRRMGESRKFVSDILKDVGSEFAKEGLKWAASQTVKMAFNKYARGNSRSGGTTAYVVPTNLIDRKPKLLGK